MENLDSYRKMGDGSNSNFIVNSQILGRIKSYGSCDGGGVNSFIVKTSSGDYGFRVPESSEITELVKGAFEDGRRVLVFEGRDKFVIRGIGEVRNGVVIFPKGTVILQKNFEAGV